MRGEIFPMTLCALFLAIALPLWAIPALAAENSLLDDETEWHNAIRARCCHGSGTLPPADPHLLRVYNVTDTTTPQAVGEAARQARENKEWLILMLHYLVEDPKIDIEYSIENFKALLAEVKKSEIPHA